MSSEVWIAQRTAEAPSALRARVDDVLRVGAPVGTDAPEQLVRVAERLLGGLVAPQGGGEHRQGALDLLAADAAVTWAFEKAADDPKTLATRAEDAMRRIAAVVQ